MQTGSRKNELIGFFALFVLSNPLFSADGHYYLGASIAASFAQLGTHTPQISYLSGAVITDSYPLSKSGASSAVIGVNGGFEFNSINSKPAVALGLGVYTTPGNYKYSGQLIEAVEESGSTVLYNYSYNVSSSRLMAEMQLTWKLMDAVYPFINLGVGPAWNRMSGYTETVATSDGIVALPPFLNNTQNKFAYQAGLGMSIAFNCKADKTDVPHERISLGYRYANLGGTSFGSRGMQYPYALNTGTLSTNEVYLGYTHLI
jgi:opacity protein-like surface antigen